MSTQTNIQPTEYTYTLPSGKVSATYNVKFDSFTLRPLDGGFYSSLVFLSAADLGALNEIKVAMLPENRWPQPSSNEAPLAPSVPSGDHLG